MNKSVLRTLTAKQFTEIWASFFVDRKNGKQRTKGKTALFFCLYALLLLYIAGISFVSFYGLAGAFAGIGYDWLYASMLGIASLLLGVFGSVFSTYAALYQAKDNDLLLSLPIKPRTILFSRVINVVFMSAIFDTPVYLAGILARVIAAPITAKTLVSLIVLYFALLAVTTAFSCFFGFLVAWIASKCKRKSAISVVLSLVFFIVYFLVVSRASTIFEVLANRPDDVAAFVQGWLWPFYAMGLAGSGDLLALLGFTAAAAALLALAWFVLSASFLRIATKSDATVRREYKEEKEIKQTSVAGTLLKKEFRRYLGCPIYILNCSLGTIFAPIAAVAVFFLKGQLMPVLAEAPEIVPFLPIAVFAAGAMLTSMNDLTAPSVSLEGKYLWVLKSLPVSPYEIFAAKQRLHILLTVPPVLLFAVCAGIAFEVPMLDLIWVVVALAYLIEFEAAFGLFLNLNMPNLAWTNEAIAVKQGFAVLIALFGDIFFAVGLSAGAYFLGKYTETWIGIVGITVLCVFAYRLLQQWLKTKGTQLFEKL